MRKFNNKSGFTLIEIIVVLIIIGILAAIALPNIFGNIQKSKGSQALTQMDEDKAALESCLAKNSGIAPNTAPCSMAGQNLTVGPINGWSYSIAPGATAVASATGGAVTQIGGTYLGNNLTYTLSATDGTNTITLERAVNGTWTCSTGTASPYTGIC
jgi:prepilin-type N-terminal cleavage/methylation domain-containing protein